MEQKRYSVCASVSVELTQRAIDDIMYSALDGGGISGWADSVEVIGEKKAATVSEEIGHGGFITIHDFRGKSKHIFGVLDFLKGVRLYLENSCHVAIEDGTFPEGAVDVNDADCIVQYGIFGEVRYNV